MKLAVRSWGDGPRLAVLIHGLFSDSRCWHRMAPALADRGYRVLAPDLRGHGESPRGRYSLTDWALDILETVPAAPDLVVGHSLGGAALAIAAHPLAAEHTVYLDPAWRLDAAGSVRSFAEWTSWLDWPDASALRDVLGSRWSAEDVALRWDSMQHTDPAVVAGLAIPGGYDVSPETATARALIVAADPSEYVTDHDEFRRRGFDVSVLPGIGHSAFREDLPGLLRLLDGWLEH